MKNISNRIYPGYSPYPQQQTIPQHPFDQGRHVERRETSPEYLQQAKSRLTAITKHTFANLLISASTNYIRYKLYPLYPIIPYVDLLKPLPIKAHRQKSQNH